MRSGCQRSLARRIEDERESHESVRRIPLSDCFTKAAGGLGIVVLAVSHLCDVRADTSSAALGAQPSLCRIRQHHRDRIALCRQSNLR
jgi:hypothetical protein